MQNKLRSIIVFAFGLLVFPIAASGLPVLTATLYAADESAASGDEPYRAGRRALDESRWAEAARLFAESAGSTSGHGDAAHYWWAYALHKDGRSADALEVLGDLRRSFESSSWLDDSRALELEIREGTGGASLPPEGGDEELQLLALNGLIHSDSGRALPLIRKFLAGDHSSQLEERALFVLSQSGSPEAASLLAEIARGGQYPEMQDAAIRFLGMSGAAGAEKTLADIYRAATDREIKKRVLRSFLIADNTDFVLEVARSESDVELKRAAIHQLGVASNSAALRQLYASESSLEVKQQILHSQFLAQDTEALLEVVRNESNQDLRQRAIRSLGMVGSDEGAVALGELYDQTADPDSRRRIIEALFLGNQAERLIRIAKDESDPELRKEAVRRLSMMQSEEGLAFLMSILDR